MKNDGQRASGAAQVPEIERLLLIIGAMKCGTTTLYKLLCQHPAIARHRTKEPSFFGSPGKWKKGRDSYLRDWPDFDPRRHRYAMEASTDYTKLPKFEGVGQRIASFGLPARYIFIARDPVDRIESHLAHNIAKGRIGHDISMSHPMLQHAISVSRYAYQLDEFKKDLPEAQILVLDFEDLKRDITPVMASCTEFLDIDRSFVFTPIPPANTRKSDNAGDRFRLPDEMRAELREKLRPGAQLFASRYGFDISSWALD